MSAPRPQRRTSRPAGSVVFVARERELEVLGAALARARTGTGQLILVAGEAGIGKTSLLEELQRRTSPRSFAFLWGRCHADTGVTELGPWIEIIEARAEGVTNEALEAELGDGLAAIADLASGIARRFPSMTTPPREARARVQDDIKTFVRNLSQRKPCVVVIDDLHWADDASLSLLEKIRRDLSGMRVLVACTYRDTDLHAEPARAARIASLLRGSQTLALPALDADDAERMMRAISGHSPSLTSDVSSIAAVVMFLLIVIRREQMRVAEIAPMVDGLAAAAASWPAVRYCHANVLALAGAPNAEAVFASLASGNFTDLPDDFGRLTCLGAATEACVLVGTPDQARRLMTLLLPYEERHMVIGVAVVYFDPATHCLARLAARAGEWDRAQAWYARALDSALAMGAACRAVHIRLNHADMLLTRGRTEDRARAVELAETARADAHRIGLPRVVNCAESILARAGVVADSQPRFVFRHEGEVWTLRFEGTTVRLKDSYGLHYIARLLRHPRVPIHVLELAGGKNGRALAGTESTLLDARARDEYRTRLRDLEEEQRLAEDANDPTRALRARAESEALTKQLTTAIGIGGRRRRTSGASEKARINVTRTIRLVVSRLERDCPELAHFLDTSIRTGTFCTYVPEPRSSVSWSF